MEDSLKEKTIKGVQWTLIESVFNAIIPAALFLLLSRLLSPAEFGIIAVILIFINISNVFVDSGFASALIRKTEATKSDYSTVFFYNISLSLLFFILIIIGSPWIASYFDMPNIEKYLIVASLTLPINALANVQRAYQSKVMNFKIQSIITLVTALAGGISAVILALLDYGVWALVAQYLVKAITQTLCYWGLGKWNLLGRISKTSLKEFWDFGSKLLATRLIEQIYKNLFTFVIGKVYGANELGYYNRAYAWTNMFTIAFTNMVSKVSYTASSAVKDDQKRIKGVYQKFVKTTMLISFTVMFCLAACSESAVVFLLGEKWLPAVKLLQILCFIEVLTPLNTLNVNILTVCNKTNLVLRNEILKKILVIPIVLVGVYIGIKPMLLYTILYTIIIFFINAYYAKELINYSIFEQIKDLAPSFFISVVVAGAIAPIIALGLSPFLTLLFQIICGVILLIIIHERVKLTEYIEIKQLTIDKIKLFFK